MASTSSFNQGSNAWPGWEVQVLHDLGAPVSKLNVAFLDEWQTYERSNARNNPLNITAPVGSGTLNSAGVQSYSDRIQAAQYTANAIKQYPTLYKMLKTDNVKGVALGSTSIFGGHLSPLQHLVSDLNKWGSHSFAAKLQGQTSAIDKTVTTGQSVVSDITHPFEWLGQNWDRVLLGIAGFVLLGFGLYMIFKSQSTPASAFG